MKTLSILTVLSLAIQAFGQPIRSGPLTTNTPAQSTNVVRAIATNSLLHASKLTPGGSLPPLNAAALTNLPGSGTFNFVALTNKPAPISLVSTNDAQTLTNIDFSGFSTATKQAITNSTTGGGSGTFNFVALTNKPAPINLVSTNDGRTLTNIFPSTFASIAAMVADTQIPIGSEVTVRSYYGTNESGGGKFIRDSTSAATNMGMMFAAAGGGRWRRVVDSDNCVRLDWFGLWEIVDRASIHDSTRQFTNALAVTPNGGTLSIPSMLIAVQDIWITNRYAITIKGETDLFGAHLVFPEQTPVISYLGVGGTNSAVFHIIDSQSIEFAHIGIDTETPVFDTPPGAITNHAWTGIDIDQSPSGWPQITTDCRFEKCTFRTRSTVPNPWWTGIYISKRSLSNVEAMRVRECLFYGAYQQDMGDTNYGIGIRIGASANALGEEVTFCQFTSCRTYVWMDSGNVRIKGGLGTGASVGFYCGSWVDTLTIEDFRSEHHTQFAFLGGGTSEAVLRNNALASLLTPTNLATIQIEGSPKLTISGNSWDQYAECRVYFVDPAWSPRLYSRNNRYPHADFAKIGFNQFAWAKSSGEIGGHGSDITFGRNNTTTFSSIDQTYGTNFPFATLYNITGNGNPSFGNNYQFHVPVWGDHAGATNLNASELRSGTVPLARLPALSTGMLSNQFSTNVVGEFVQGPIRFQNTNAVGTSSNISTWLLNQIGNVTNNTDILHNSALVISNSSEPYGSSLTRNVGLTIAASGGHFNSGIWLPTGNGISLGSALAPNDSVSIYSSSTFTRQFLFNNATIGLNANDGTYLSCRDDGEYWLNNQEANGKFNFKIADTDAFVIASSGITASSLAGSGTRMVVADTSGVLGTQAIPSGGAGGSSSNAVTSISSNNVAVSTVATNLHFWAGANTSLSFTNSPEGDVDVVIASTGGGTVDIAQLAGTGTNTYLRSPTIGGVQTNDSLIVSGSITRTNFTTGIRSVESAAGHLFYPSNSVVPTVNINGVTGDLTATQFIGAGGALTYTGSGNNGNLSTSVDTLQELNDAVDNLSLGAGGGATNAVTTISTNGTALTTAATNLNFWQGTGITITGTNLGGLVGMRFDGSAQTNISYTAVTNAPWIDANAGFGTNNTLTAATNYGSIGRTNWTWMDASGWHNTNNSAASQRVDIRSGDVFAQRVVLTNGTAGVGITNLSTGNTTNSGHIHAATMTASGAATFVGTVTAPTFSGTATVAATGDSATAFFGSGTLEPALMATNAAFSNSWLRATSATTAQWSRDGSGLTNIAGSGSGDVTAAANFATDNRLIRSDGTSKGVQASPITAFDDGAISNVLSLSLASPAGAIQNYTNGPILQWQADTVKLYKPDGQGSPIEITDTALSFASPDTSEAQIILSGGNITVSGTLGVGTLDITTATAQTLEFEGATADGFETQVIAIDPTADRTNFLPNASGVLALSTNIAMVTSVTVPMGAWFTNNVADGATLTAASAATITNTADSFQFTDGVTNRIRTRFALPWDWNAGTVQIGLRSLFTATNGLLATNVVYAVRAAAIGDGDNASNPTFGTAIWTTNKVHTTAYISREAITSALTVGNTPTSAKSILWEIQRLGAQSGDNSTNVASLTEVRVYYQKNTRADFPVATP